ncbi:glycosyltransferase family 90 protein [Xylariaceae sp. FL0255]|nr:glycosyltransferase family 90 protein [Xylariaceae sp. FL0255]
MSASAALLCTTLTQFLASEQTELPSEVLCWISLPWILDKRSPTLDAELPPISATLKTKALSRPNPPSSTSLWMIALCITVFSVFRAGWGLVVLFPASTPILLMIHRKTTLRETPKSAWLIYTIPGTLLVTLLSIASLPVDSFFELAPSMIPLCGIILTYIILTPGNDKTSPNWLESLDIEKHIKPISQRATVLLLVALGIEWTVFGIPRGHLVAILCLSLVKALSWYSLSHMTPDSSWLAASAAGTFAILASRNPFAENSDARALLRVIASILALGQCTQLAPKQARTISALWILSLVPLVPYLADLAAIQYSLSSSITDFRNHPVEVLSYEAKSKFKYLLANQSTTYAAADKEYSKRYGLEPPPGFKDWYDFAVANQSPIIDGFDIIYEGISPFLKLSGKEISDAMNQLYDLTGSEVWRCKINGIEPLVECSHHWRTNDRYVAGMLRKLTSIMPKRIWDITLLVNHLDEPRMVIPQQSPEHSQVNVTDMAREPVWDMVTKSCKSERKHISKHKSTIETYGLPFVTDRITFLDVCQNPSYNQAHGLFLSPTSFPVIEGLVPVLSVGAPSSMSDILYPSPAYTETEYAYDSTYDIPWDKKQNKLYWAGSTTGGYTNDDGNDSWRNFHRQRFVKLALGLGWHEYSYLREGGSEQGSIIKRITSRFLNSRLYDVSFTRILQCASAVLCRSEKTYFGQRAWADRDEALHSRLAFDIDGNGIRGRFYRLLASYSTPLKMTVFREWHDERLVPWLHYVPVSVGMEELPELVHFLTSTEAGRERARRVADEGRWWYERAFREIDLAIYVYRLLLEMARLQDPERPAYGIV